MKLIVLTGLVVIEKINLTVELADFYLKQGQSVSIVDNIARLAIDSEVAPVMPIRINDDITQRMNIVAQQDSDVVLLAVSESTNPDTLFTSLELLHDEIDNLEIYTMALIDLRTCDCFPNVRERLELYADQVVMMPYKLEEVLHVAFIN